MAKEARKQVGLNMRASLYDDLTKLARDSRLQPVYVPFWRFSLTATLVWRAQTSSGRDKRWKWEDGETTFFYDDFLEPGAGRRGRGPPRLAADVGHVAVIQNDS